MPDVSAREDRRALLPGQVAAFLLTFGGIVLLGLEQGAYDLVIRQQVAVVIWWLLALAFLVGLLPRTTPSAPGWVVIVALVLLGLWTTLSLGWSPDDDRTLVEIARVAMHLGVVVLVATALDRNTWRAAIAGASAAAAFICLAALTRRLFPDTFGEDVITEAFGSNRLSYPLGYWNAVGAWAGMTSALCLAWSAHARSWLVRGAALAIVPMAITTAYLTYSRASLGGTILGLIILLCASRNRVTLAVHAVVAAGFGVAAILAVRDAPEIAQAKGGAGAGTITVILVVGVVVAFLLAFATSRFGLDRLRLSPRNGRIAFVGAGVLATLAIAVAAVTVGPDAWDQFQDTTSTQSTDPSERLRSLNGSRYAVWSAALNAADDAPLKGTGAGTFEFVWNERATKSEFVRDGHSLYLEPLTELGIPGLLSVLLLVLGVAWALVAALRHAEDPADRGALAAAAAACGAFFFGAGVDWLWESTAVTALALILAGAGIAAGGRPSRALRWPVRVPIAVGAVVLCLVQLPGLVSTSEIRRSQTAFERGDLASAQAHADDAADAQPWSPAPYVQRALIAERAGRFGAAVIELRRAQSRSPQDWRVPLVLARVEARRGNASAALAAYRRAKELRPRSRFFATSMSGTSG
ncbi:MAG: O-antigen ligase family protein [Solirubrobacteraceae bacterium]|nr:O-antigen ligase family protein [Solirubrobacteraceae bacterium]